MESEKQTWQDGMAIIIRLVLMIRVFPKQARGTEYIVLPPIIVEPNSVETAPSTEYADKDVEIGRINTCTTQYVYKVHRPSTCNGMYIHKWIASRTYRNDLL